MNQISEMVKKFIVDLVLSGAETEEITADTPLNERGILDSVSTTKLVLFLEDKFNIEIQPDDLAAGRLSSLASIEQLVEDRQAGVA